MTYQVTKVMQKALNSF